MQSTNKINRQFSNTSATQTDDGFQQNSMSQSQQERQNNRGWRCEVFVDIPMTRDLMQGPLNIQLPSIQLPTGLTNLVGQLANNSNNQQSQALQQQTSQREHGQQLTQQSSLQNPLEQQFQSPSISSPASTVVSWGRAASTPAVLNSSIGSSSTSDSFVIDMDEDTGTVRNQNTNNPVIRRRSSSPLRSNNVVNRRQQTTTKEMHPSSTFRTEPHLTQRSTTTSGENTAPTSSSDSTRSTNGELITASDDHENSDETHNSDEDLNNLRTRLGNLFSRRHQIVHEILNQTGQFPSTYVIGVIICFFLVILFVLINFFAIKFIACLALIFSLLHYSDVLAFKRYISGTGNGWIIAGKIALRQLMVLEVLGQYIYVLPTATFQVTANRDLPEPTFWSTLYIVLITEYFIMDCVLSLKILISKLPKCSPVYKRSLYQWLEYTSVLYRFIVPFFQWNAHFSTIWWTVLYGGIKILLLIAMIWGWLLVTLRVLRSTHLGNFATEEECKQQNDQCTICFEKFATPIKLKCSHIFCTECIRTWLDREHTCPICRAIITKDDNNYRNGESLFPSLF